MGSDLQKTLEEIMEFKGVGLHSGVEANLRIKPAEPNYGIKFKRTDITWSISCMLSGEN